MENSSTDIQIVPMRTEHLAQVMKIEKSVFRDAWSAGAFVEVISLSPHNWVALAKGEVAGYLITQWVLDEIHILNVAVASEMHRRGIGRKLMEYVIELGRGKRMRDLFLEVRVGNAAAIALYRAFGFTVGGTRRKYYNDGEDALLMQCRIEAAEGGAEMKLETDQDSEI